MSERVRRIRAGLAAGMLGIAGACIPPVVYGQEAVLDTEVDVRIGRETDVRSGIRSRGVRPHRLPPFARQTTYYGCRCRCNAIAWSRTGRVRSSSRRAGRVMRRRTPARSALSHVSSMAAAVTTFGGGTPRRLFRLPGATVCTGRSPPSTRGFASLAAALTAIRRDFEIPDVFPGVTVRPIGGSSP
jgi:hypothetical protein